MSTSRACGSNKVFVGNVAYRTNEEELARVLGEKFGAVAEARIATNKDDGASRGFAFVTFANHESARRAVNCTTSTKCNGKSLNISVTRSTKGGGGGKGSSSPKRAARRSRGAGAAAAAAVERQQRLLLDHKATATTPAPSQLPVVAAWQHASGTSPSPLPQPQPQPPPPQQEGVGEEREPPCACRACEFFAPSCDYSSRAIPLPVVATLHGGRGDANLLCDEQYSSTPLSIPPPPSDSHSNGDLSQYESLALPVPLPPTVL